jgi:hypothetical protein
VARETPTQTAAATLGLVKHETESFKEACKTAEENIMKRILVVDDDPDLGRVDPQEG